MPPPVQRQGSGSRVSSGIRRMNSWGAPSHFEVPAALPPRVQALVDLGFSREQAADALKRSGGNIQEAATELLSGAPAAPPAVHAAPVPFPPPPLSHPHPTGEASRPALRAPSPAPLPDTTQAAVRELVGMGFDEDVARVALARCRGAVQEAVQLLLDLPAGETLASAAPAAPAPPAALAAPTAPGHFSGLPVAIAVPAAPLAQTIPRAVPAPLAAPTAPAHFSGLPVATAVPATLLAPAIPRAVPVAVGLDAVASSSSSPSFEPPSVDPLVGGFAEMGFSRPTIEAALARAGRDRDKTLTLLLDPSFAP